MAESPKSAPQTDVSSTEAMTSQCSFVRRGFGLWAAAYLWVILYPILATLSKPLTDPDLGYHLQAGSMVFREHALPLIDPFSCTAHGAPWVDHEWLAETIMFALWHAFGTSGIVLYRCFGAAAAIACLAALLYRYSGSHWITIVLTLFAATLLRPFLTERPDLLTFIGLPLCLLIVGRERWATPRLAFAMTFLLFVVWSNAHAGAVLGLGIVLIGAGYRAMSRSGTHAGRSLLRRVSVSIAVGATLGVLANPHGIHLLSYVASTSRNPFTQNVIAEWLPPNTRSPWFRYPFGSWILFPIVIASTLSGSIPALYVGYLLLGLAMATTSVRHVSVAVILSAPAVALAVRLGVSAARSPLLGLAACVRQHAMPLGSRCARQIPFRATWTRQRSSANLFASISTGRHRSLPVDPHAVAAACLALILLAPQVVQANHVRAWDSGEYPIAAAQWMDRHSVGRRMYNPYNWGGYLVWVLCPHGYRVFVDGRAETVYPLACLRDFMRIDSASPGWTDLLEEYRIETMIIPIRSTLDEAVSRSRIWTQVYRDSVAAVFVKSPLTSKGHSS